MTFVTDFTAPMTSQTGESIALLDPLPINENAKIRLPPAAAFSAPGTLSITRTSQIRTECIRRRGYQINTAVHQSVPTPMDTHLQEGPASGVPVVSMGPLKVFRPIRDGRRAVGRVQGRRDDHHGRRRSTAQAASREGREAVQSEVEKHK